MSEKQQSGENFSVRRALAATGLGFVVFAGSAELYNFVHGSDTTITILSDFAAGAVGVVIGGAITMGTHSEHQSPEGEGQLELFKHPR